MVLQEPLVLKDPRVLLVHRGLLVILGPMVTRELVVQQDPQDPRAI